MRRPTLLLLLVAAAAVSVLGASSGATFTATSSSPDSGITTAAVFTDLRTTVGPVPAWVRGTVSVPATVAHATGPAAVRVQTTADGVAWTTACVDLTSPYACGWATSGLPDGSAWQVRSQATDVTGTAASTPVTTRVDNAAPTGTVAMPPNGSQASPVRVTGTGADAHSGVASVAVQVRVNGGAWSTPCTGVGPVVPCDVALGRGQQTLEARLVVTDVVGNTTTTTPSSANVVAK